MKPYSDLAAMADRLTAWRRDFHRFPEVGMAVPITARKVADRLRDCGVDQVIEGVAGHGVIGIVDHGEGPCIALRSDMDALPIQEMATRSYTSQHDGCMHACGHDGHMTMLLGAARRLATERRFRGRAVLIFQPGEETLEGAKAIVADGVLDRFGVEAVFGIHNLPGGPAGHLRIPDGAVMASSNRFSIRILGSGGHAALPELSRNPLQAAAALVERLHAWQKRAPDGSPVVVAVTSIAGGAGVYNVIPDEAQLGGSLRYLDTECHELVVTDLRQDCAAVAAENEVEVVASVESLCPVTRNSPSHAAFARSIGGDVAGAAGVSLGPPLMASEDFSFFLAERPGVYALIANGDSAPLHHSSYDFNDALLPAGASYLAGLVEGGGGVV